MATHSSILAWKIPHRSGQVRPKILQMVCPNPYTWPRGTGQALGYFCKDDFFGTLAGWTLTSSFPVTVFTHQVCAVLSGIIQVSLVLIIPACLSA